MARTATPGAAKEVQKLEKEILKTKQKLTKLRKKLPKKEISDYTFKTWEGADVTLSSLFDERNELIVVHNMGKACRYCTLWADGFNGIYWHMENRLPFVVVSPDDYQTQRAFGQMRGWKFRMFSSYGTRFFADMGFASKDESPWPGVSAFVRDKKGRIFQVAKTYFGPGDDFCAVWHFLDLLPKGANGWEPQYSY
ncbi:MAG: DUF899 family protein [Candidatus Zixiibacteriota bacterium]